MTVDDHLLYAGDAGDVCRCLERGVAFDLVYLDPPYAVGGVMSTRDRVGQARGRKQAASGRDAYRDDTGIDALVAHLEQRLALVRERMSDHGALLLHMDYRAVHDAKVALDRVFGRSAFAGDIVWTPGNGARGARGFSVTHQTILIYAKSQRRELRWRSDHPLLREPYAETSQAMHFKKIDDDGRRYRERRIKGKSYRYYADEGRRLGTVWTDIPAMVANTPLRKEATGYPTQKPERLLERIVRAASAEGDTVADFDVRQRDHPGGGRAARPAFRGRRRQRSGHRDHQTAAGRRADRLPLRRRQGARQQQGLAHAAIGRLARAGQIVGGAVVDAGADDRQPQRHVHRLAEAQQLADDGRLVVVHGHHAVVLTGRGLPKGGLRAERPDQRGRQPPAAKRRARSPNSGLDDGALLVAEQPRLAGVWIERSHHDARAWLAQLDQHLREPPAGDGHAASRDGRRHLAQREVRGDQRGREPVAVEGHHDVLRPKRAREVLGVSAKQRGPRRIARRDHGLRHRRSHQRFAHTPRDELGCLVHPCQLRCAGGALGCARRHGLADPAALRPNPQLAGGQSFGIAPVAHRHQPATRHVPQLGSVTEHVGIANQDAPNRSPQLGRCRHRHLGPHPRGATDRHGEDGQRRHGDQSPGSATL